MPTNDTHACPACAAALALTWPTPIDRLMRHVAARRRYRCISAACGWEGTLRTRQFETVRPHQATDTAGVTRLSSTLR